MKNTANIVYGIHPVEQLIEHRTNQIDRVYVTAHQKDKLFYLLKLCRKKKIPCQTVPTQKLAQLAGTEKHQGIVALCSIKPYTTIADFYEKLKQLSTPPLVLVPASCEDPHNLGALVRTSVAFNVTAIFMERKKTAPLNATVAKTSAGLWEYMSFIKPTNLEKEIEQLKQHDFTILGVESGKGNALPTADLTRPLCCIIGGEHHGIPPYLQKLCTEFVSIPMAPHAHSLNLSVAGSLVLYECARQRGFNGIL